MCGIAGLANCGNREVLSRMTHVLVHRGPDSDGSFLDGDVGLAARQVEGPAVDGLRAAFLDNWAETAATLFEDRYDRFPHQPNPGDSVVQCVRGAAETGRRYQIVAGVPDMMASEKSLFYSAAFGMWGRPASGPGRAGGCPPRWSPPRKASPSSSPATMPRRYFRAWSW